MPKPGEPHSGRWVAYYRVSTVRQGDSGLGLGAQRRHVNDFLNGGNWTLAAEYTEVETGKRSDRPQLAAALAACKRLKAKLIVAKLDRLSRNVAFISTLINCGVEFVAADRRTSTSASFSDSRRSRSEKTDNSFCSDISARRSCQSSFAAWSRLLILWRATPASFVFSSPKCGSSFSSFATIASNALRLSLVVHLQTREAAASHAGAETEIGMSHDRPSFGPVTGARRFGRRS